MIRLTLAFCAGLAVAGPATAQTETASADRAATCAAITGLAENAATLYAALHDITQACIAQGRDTPPCLVVAETVATFDGRAMVADLGTAQAGLVALCAGPRG